MIKEIMQEAINEQIIKELYSSNLYLSMAAYYHSLNLNGFANWMRVQAQEENAHAMKFFNYLLERGGSPRIGAIPAPPHKWEGVLQGFETALDHERIVTQSINALADLAIKEGDHATHILLQWFITEQVEEESTACEMVDRIKLAGDSPGGLFFLDSEVKQRKFTAGAGD